MSILTFILGDCIYYNWTPSKLINSSQIGLVQDSSILDDIFYFYEAFEYTRDTGKMMSISLHLSYVLHSVIGQLQTSSYQLDIEMGRYAQIPLNERIDYFCY